MTQLDLQTPEQHRRRYEELKERARAKAAAAVEPTTPVEPPTAAVRERIPAGWYGSYALPRFGRIRLTTRGGAASVMIWNQRETSERLSLADSVKLQWTARLGKGRVLFSDMGRVLASIVEDTASGHDPLVGGSTPRSHPAPARNTRDNLFLAAGKFGLRRSDVAPCMTFFARVEVGEGGEFSWRGGDDAGAYVELRAEMELLVAVSNTPHALDPGPTDPVPLEVACWQGPQPAPDDLCRGFSEEAVRGFENTDRLFGGVAA